MSITKVYIPDYELSYLEAKPQSTVVAYPRQDVIWEDPNCFHEFVNLTVIWHDVIEIPQENYKNIIYQTNYCSMYNVHITYIPTCLRSCKITSSSWNEFVKEVNMRRWAYLSDLLPKGGK